MSKINKDEVMKGLGTKEPPLKHNDKAFKEELKTINVYGIPAGWVDVIKKKGYSFASFARIAIEEKMKNEGLLKD